MPTAHLWPVEGPIPVPYPNNLVAIATLIPDDEPDPRWEAGLAVWETPCDTAAWVYVDPCGQTALTTQRAGGVGSAPSFGIVAGLTCTAAGIGSEAEFKARARDVFAAYEPAKVETALETHPLAGSLTANYQLSGLTNIAGTFSVAAGIARLEASRRTLGVLHMTPRLATLAYSARVLERAPNGRLFTANGTPVVTGAGYAAASDATTERAYITGPVEIRRSALFITPPDLASALDRDHNDVKFYAQRIYAIAYDRCDANRLTITR